MDYQKATIYILEPTIEYADGDIFYGSTVQPLHKRLYEHKKDFKRGKWSIPSILFDKYGLDNVKIVFVSNCPVNSKAELIAHEANYIRANMCLNKQVKEYLILKDRLLGCPHS